MNIEELESLISRESINNIVISPGPGTPCKGQDAGITLQIFSRFLDVPILGVCFGFQALCLIHGGASVVRSPEPVHGRISTVIHSGDSLFDGIPNGFDVVRYHSLSVVEASLNSSVIPTAWSSSSGHQAVSLEEASNQRVSSIVLDENRILMGARHMVYPHYGVQYHPESVATKFGTRLMANFRNITLQRMKLFSSIVDNGLPSSPQIPGPKFDSHAGALEAQILTLPGVLPSIDSGTLHIVETLFGTRTENLFWLDSSTEERTRFSYFGSMGGSLWRRISYHLHADRSGGRLKMIDSNNCMEEIECDSIFDWITKETSRFDTFGEKFASLPFEFWGGLVGYLGYELKCQSGGRIVHRSETADACFFVVDRFIAVDHHSGDVYVAAVHVDGEDSESESKLWVQNHAQAIQNLVSVHSKDHHVGFQNQQLDAFKERHTKESYVKKVHECLSALYDGDSYELCLTNMLTSKWNVDPWNFYKRLRNTNNAPYSAFIDFSEVGGPIICSSSPERFLRGTRSGMLEAKPIKGTAKRDLLDKGQDAQIALNLYNSEKDRAENLMIVDLLRNDLGRVSKPGTVCVTGLMEIETFATVHQMVSTIVSQKKDALGVGDVVKACFPGGSMTGAPKVRSMDILDILEQGPRGVYSGSLGYFSWSKAFDLNIVIRTAIFSGDNVSVGAGGAIVVQSDPLSEYEEMRLKFETLSKAWNPAQ